MPEGSRHELESSNYRSTEAALAGRVVVSQELETMGREVKRVPTDFNHPLGELWPGYVPDHPLTDEEADSGSWQQHPPTGPGYQLWENTTEGSPKSPVFDSPEALAQWCAENATTWGNCRAAKEEWQQMIEDGHIYGRLGNIVGL